MAGVYWPLYDIDFGVNSVAKCQKLAMIGKAFYAYRRHD
jgi:hypothetical protein